MNGLTHSQWMEGRKGEMGKAYRHLMKVMEAFCERTYGILPGPADPMLLLTTDGSGVWRERREGVWEDPIHKYTTNAPHNFYLLRNGELRFDPQDESTYQGVLLGGLDPTLDGEEFLLNLDRYRPNPAKPGFSDVKAVLKGNGLVFLYTTHFYGVTTEGLTVTSPVTGYEILGEQRMPGRAVRI